MRRHLAAHRAITTLPVCLVPQALGESKGGSGYFGSQFVQPLCGDALLWPRNAYTGDNITFMVKHRGSDASYALFVLDIVYGEAAPLDLRQISSKMFRLRNGVGRSALQTAGDHSFNVVFAAVG